MQNVDKLKKVYYYISEGDDKMKEKATNKTTKGDGKMSFNQIVFERMAIIMNHGPISFDVIQLQNGDKCYGITKNNKLIDWFLFCDSQREKAICKYESLIREM